MYFMMGGSKQIQYALMLSVSLKIIYIYIQFHGYVYPTMEENYKDFQNIWQCMLTLYRLQRSPKTNGSKQLFCLFHHVGIQELDMANMPGKVTLTGCCTAIIRPTEIDTLVLLLFSCAQRVGKYIYLIIYPQTSGTCFLDYLLLLNMFLFIWFGGTLGLVSPPQVE